MAIVTLVLREEDPRPGVVLSPRTNTSALSPPLQVDVQTPEPAEAPQEVRLEAPVGAIAITYEGVYDGHCEALLDDRGNLSGRCEIERILGNPPQDPAFGGSMELTGNVKPDASGFKLIGTVQEEISFTGVGDRTSAVGDWSYSSPEGWKRGGNWRARLR